MRLTAQRVAQGSSHSTARMTIVNSGCVERAGAAQGEGSGVRFRKQPEQSLPRDSWGSGQSSPFHPKGPQAWACTWLKSAPSSKAWALSRASAQPRQLGSCSRARRRSRCPWTAGARARCPS